MNKKLKEFIIIFIVLLILIAIGCVIYERYSKKEENDVINNYYSTEYLFNNGYIENPQDIESVSDNTNGIYMYLDKDNTLYIKDTSNNYNKEVKGLPQGDIKVYYNVLKNNYYEIACIKDNELYYVNICLSKKEKPTFENISNEVKDIYNISTDNDLTSKFIITTINDELKTITKEKDEYTLSNNIEEINPYFDYICLNENEKTCNKTKIYITFDKELISNGNIIKDEEENKIIVKDVFGVADKTKKNKYDFKIYILDINNNIYILEKEKTKLYSEKKVENIEYQQDNNIINSVFLTYEDNSSEIIKTNGWIATSTLYERETNLPSE